MYLNKLDRESECIGWNIIESSVNEIEMYVYKKYVFCMKQNKHYLSYEKRNT